MSCLHLLVAQLPKLGPAPGEGHRTHHFSMGGVSGNLQTYFKPVKEHMYHFHTKFCRVLSVFLLLNVSIEGRR